jgi:hypothetical protein
MKKILLLSAILFASTCSLFCMEGEECGYSIELEDGYCVNYLIQTQFQERIQNMCFYDFKAAQHLGQLARQEIKTLNTQSHRILFIYGFVDKNGKIAGDDILHLAKQLRIIFP